jgi:hypothetical protein
MQASIFNNFSSITTLSFLKILNKFGYPFNILMTQLMMIIVVLDGFRKSLMKMAIQENLLEKV